MHQKFGGDRPRAIRLRRKRERRNALQRDRKRERRRQQLTYGQAREFRPSAPVGRRLIVAPARLSLRTSEYEATMNFLSEVREAVIVRGERASLDLRACELISPEMAPVLAAEVQRLRFLKGSDVISGASPRDERARSVLHAMGFFELLGMRDPAHSGVNVTYSIRTGTALDGAITKEMADAIGVALKLGDDEQEPIQKALNEALENITDHAYLDRERLIHPAELHRWWISAVTSSDRRSTYVLAYDLGMTIPATIEDTAKARGPRNLAALMDFLRKGSGSSDERLLAAAFEEGVTRREDKKGGRGLGKMAQLMHEFDTGELTVWSGSACATLTKARPGEVETQGLPVCFPGTFVMWHLEQETPG